MTSLTLEEISPSRQSAGAPVSVPSGLVGIRLADDGNHGDEQDDDEVVVFQATPAQRRFWLLDQLVPGGNPALNMPLAIRLRGTLDPRALEESLNAVVQRHEALRTTFHYEKGRLLQMISPAMPVKISVVDATDFPAEQRAQVPAHVLAEEARKPFDLASGPLLRAKLVRLAPNEHLFVCPTHHIVADGWSNGIFVRELGRLYSAAVDGKSAPLAELPMHFADFAQWQTGLLESGGFDAQLSYWRARLSGDLPCSISPRPIPGRSGADRLRRRKSACARSHRRWPLTSRLWRRGRDAVFSW